MRLILIGLAVLLWDSAASAACVCRCVDGEARAICASPADSRPVCVQSLCPLATPARPLDIYPTQPIGRPGCSRQQVLNPRSGLYEWRQVCE
jgi:hypothetical protein